MPMLSCVRCGVRQYTAAAHVEEPRCVACDHPLAAAKPADPLKREPVTAEAGRSR